MDSSQTTSPIPVLSDAPNGAEMPPYAAGFRSFWRTDPARAYRTAFDNGATYGGGVRAPRPVLVCVWYPAAGTAAEPMRHEEYLDFVPDDPALVPLATALAEYERDGIAHAFARVKEAEMSEAQRQAVTRVLQRSTPCVRDAAPSPGPFPLVLYHGGSDSTLEENALLCEELACFGYVVIGGPYFRADGSSFNVDYFNAGREFEFLLRLAADMENVDLRHVGIAGHSLGAQAALKYAARAGVGVDAIVALDTTLDYWTTAIPFWSDLVPVLKHGHENYITPTLFAAGPRALFELADSLTRADRVYLTFPHLGHDEFTSQGEEKAAFAAAVAEEPKAKEEKTRHAGATAERGRSLRRFVRAYLDAKLKDDTEAFAVLEALRSTRLGAGPRVEIAPVGASGPEPDSGEFTPRILIQALKNGGVAAVIEKLQAARDRGETEDWEVDVLAQLTYFLADADRLDEAKCLFDFARSRGQDIRPQLLNDAGYWASINRFPDYVAVCARLEAALAGTGTVSL